MARTGSLDPLTRYRFTVYFKIDGDKEFIKKAAFESVTSPRIDFQIEEYREGGRHLNPHQITTGVQFSPVTFRRGKSFSSDFYNWVGLVFRAFYGDRLGHTGNYRGTIVIDHHDRTGRVIKKYVLLHARPQAYIPASNFDSKDDSEVSIETLIVTYEGYAEFSRSYDNLTGALGEAGAALAAGVQKLLNPQSTNGDRTTLSPGISDDVETVIQNIYQTSNKS
jgi:phage tail-like protein